MCIQHKAVKSTIYVNSTGEMHVHIYKIKVVRIYIYKIKVVSFDFTFYFQKDTPFNVIKN